MPWLIFPLIPVEKKIGIHSIERMDLFGRYGTRRAVYLYYLKNSRQKKFYLPWFQHDPRYWN